MSEIFKLYIFTKDTDATDSLRGYQYQILKTLETWLLNFRDDIQEEIFCDYEDDIFQKNEISKSAKFRQIKLYSSNFSFKNEEIIKCIAHFFMLHVKSDYRNLEKEFVFEANTTIAKKYLDNNADLLREWFENQDLMSADLVVRCSNKVKEIVSKYVLEQSKVLKVDQKILNEALDVFRKLKEKDWKDFTKKIKWNFLNVDSEVEIKSIKNRVDHLILELKYPIKNEDVSSIFGSLYHLVWEKASDSNPENRKLTNLEIEISVLSTSRNDRDRWYINTYNKWGEVGPIDFFLIGEFYEIIDAAKHCRLNKYLFNHSILWLKLLDRYIKEIDTPLEFKMIALYEHVWLKILYSDSNKYPKGSLIGSEAYIQEYFNDFDNFKNANDIENAQNILNVIGAAAKLDLIHINIDLITGWEVKLIELINRKLEITDNPTEICHLLENLFRLKLFYNLIHCQDDCFVDIQSLLERIISLSSDAIYYNVSQLSTRINEYIKIILDTFEEINYQLINFLETYSDKLVDIVQVRHGKYEAAQLQKDRGISYLNRTEPFFCLKALSCFHKAKDLFNHQETVEGYILTLLNISQLYAGINMNLAAKYYALSGVWLSVFNGEEKLLKRIVDSLGMLFHADFRQGAWMSAIVDFNRYVLALHEFCPNPINFNDDMPLKSIADFSFMMYSCNLIQPDLKYLIENEICKTGYLKDEFVTPLLEDVSRKYTDIDSLTKLITAKLSDNPLNDIGEERFISFMALGSKWNISFENDYITNSVAEEFAAILQVILCEIALSSEDFHFTKGSIKIKIVVRDGVHKPEEIPSHDTFSWEVFIPYFDGKKIEEVNFHNASFVVIVMRILDRISLLPYEQVQSLFEALFRDNSLGTKTLSQNTYQKMYRLVFSEVDFYSLQRQNFDKSSVLFKELPKENNVIKWKSGLSLKYDHDLSMKYISNRYKSSLKCIHITLEKFLNNSEFHLLVNRWRKEGWEDWFIILGMMNFILNYKANSELNELNIDDEAERMSKFKEFFFKYRNLDEKDCYFEFSIEAFRSEFYNFQLQNACVIVLESFGLENKAKFPNFKAIKEFLDIRFNMAKDKNDIENPLSSILIDC